MERRSFLVNGVSSALASSALLGGSVGKSQSWFELRFYHLRNDLERKPLDDLLQNAYLPLCRNLGLGPIGCFNVVAGKTMPQLVVLTPFSSLGMLDGFSEQSASNPSWKKALEEFSQIKPMVYTRIDSNLLRAFASVPSLENPGNSKDKDPRLFELRTYESRSLQASLKKIKMFDDEEIKIFRDTGLNPLFFGQTVIGENLPSLTYMLAFPNMQAREEAWRKFLAHPDWIQLRSRPELADSELVSNISNCFLRPAAYSEIY
ncbi:MAG: NIPSNAP family protein [Terriglobia bacterium]